jgi:hypothetical protein
MGGKQRVGHGMNQISWLLTTLLVRALGPEERDAVLGDLLESVESGPRALSDVFGLVSRREGTRWMSFAPWLALITIVIPFAAVLMTSSRRIADTEAIPIWLYVSNWEWARAADATFLNSLTASGWGAASSLASLAFRSWSTGFALALLWRRSLAVNAFLLCCMLLFAGWFGGHLPLEFRARDYSGNAAVFGSTFYRLFFTPAVVTLACLFPLLHGIQDGAKEPPLHGVAVAAMATVMFALGAIQSWFWWRHRTLYSAMSWQVWWLAALQVYAAAPILCVGMHVRERFPWRRTFDQMTKLRSVG